MPARPGGVMAAMAYEAIRFQDEMEALLNTDQSVPMEGTLRRQEKARWYQGFKSGAKNERQQLREVLTAAQCGFGKIECKCDRCRALAFAVGVIDGREINE
jgi:hypothetical protein